GAWRMGGGAGLFLFLWGAGNSLRRPRRWNLLRHAEIESLPVRDSDAAALLEVLRRLDSLGDADRFDAPPQIHQHLDDVAFDRVGVQPRDQSIGDLQIVRPQLGDRLQRRIPRARVVDRDSETLVAQHVESVAEE